MIKYHLSIYPFIRLIGYPTILGPLSPPFLVLTKSPNSFLLYTFVLVLVFLSSKKLIFSFLFFPYLTLSHFSLPHSIIMICGEGASLVGYEQSLSLSYELLLDKIR